MQTSRTSTVTDSRLAGAVVTQAVANQAAINPLPRQIALHPSRVALSAILLVCCLLFAPLAVRADSIQLGAPLPPLAIERQGELVLKGEAFSYRPWALPGGLGKPHVLQYMAGTLKARSQTQAFTDRLEQEIPHDSIHVTTLINMDQILWGSGRFVIRQVKENKKEYPITTIVLDESGLGQSAWALPEKDAAIIIMDAGGSVLYFKEGAMLDADIDETIELIRGQIDSSTSQQ